ncbi:hypothetical protein [Streptomyces xiaopingdaonensis]|uniref:hypothetical protein n=1 Tax=Streptomyces xiaopingdaonensis TaxID=1565415 RepID=UPI0003800DE9|nr:hypothetical protein [Streptomyces xiaopingdaonensis]
MQGEYGVLVVLPSGGLLCLGGALANVDALFIPGGVLMMASFLVFVWGFLVTTIAIAWWPIHRLWGPRWYIRMSKQERSDALTGQFATAARRASAGSAGPAPEWLGAVVSTWGAGMVVDAETRERPDKVSRRGTVAGQLAAGEGGVWFAPNGALSAEWTDRAQFAARWEELRDVRRVPARAGVDGVRRHGFLYRSWFPRLVVTTDAGDHLFEVNFGQARRAADTLNRERTRVAR